MVVWSSLSRFLITLPQKNNATLLLKRYMSEHRALKVEVSRWQWHKYKDLLHMYLMVGMIPVLAVAGYCNIFIGPAKLAETPEGYIPKYWEYYSHPITRFIAQYCQSGYQQEYEKYMHFMFEEDEKAKMRRVAKEVEAKMAERHDYQAWYYVPVGAKYFRESKAIADETLHVMGDNLDLD